MQVQPVNLNKQLDLFPDYWSPRIIGSMNDYDFKVVKIKGDFVWHKHNDTDETFLVIKGKMRIDFRDGVAELTEGELFVVPKGVEHKPFAEEECAVLLIEPAGTLNTGDVEDRLTVKKPEKI